MIAAWGRIVFAHEENNVLHRGRMRFAPTFRCLTLLPLLTAIYLPRILVTLKSIPTKTPLSYAQGRKIRGTTLVGAYWPHSAAASHAAVLRGRVPMTGDSTGQPYLLCPPSVACCPWQLSNEQRTTDNWPFSFGGDSGVASARACWSSSHSPRLAGCPARRVLFTVGVVQIFIVGSTVPCCLGHVNESQGGATSNQL